MATRAPTSLLLVEDNPADVYLIQRAVADCGPDLQLWVMRDGPEALMVLRRELPFTHVPPPALILLDLTLPTMAGTTVLPAIRQLPAHRTTPLVVLSAAPKEREEARCLALGANAYVQKSVNYYRFYGAVQELVQRWLRTPQAPWEMGPRCSESGLRRVRLGVSVPSVD